jgi:hypothetical protein
MISERIYGQEGECTGYLPVRTRWNPCSDSEAPCSMMLNSLFGRIGNFGNKSLRRRRFSLGKES